MSRVIRTGSFDTNVHSKPIIDLIFPRQWCRCLIQQRRMEKLRIQLTPVERRVRNGIFLTWSFTNKQIMCAVVHQYSFRCWNYITINLLQTLRSTMLINVFDFSLVIRFFFIFYFYFFFRNSYFTEVHPKVSFIFGEINMVFIRLVVLCSQNSSLMTGW